MKTPLPSAPRALAVPENIAMRQRLLSQPHVAPLADYVQSLRTEAKGEVPDFDPLDGGIEATSLFLLEKPGPMTDPHRPDHRLGSGFISRDNDDGTAEAIFRFMQTAGLPRTSVALWNTVPWWNGTRTIKVAELKEGICALEDLFCLLPNLTSIVLVGKKANRARRTIEILRPDLRILSSAHPSPIVRASRRDLWDDIPRQWAKVSTPGP